jgi:PAS domain S-box-containing protein
MREIRSDGEAYGFLMSGADEGVYLFGNAIEDCNEVCCRIWGRSREDLIGRSPLEFSPEFQADGSRSDTVGPQRLESALAGQSQWFRWQYLKGGAQVSEALVHLEPVRVDGHRRLLVRWRDLLDLERAEHAVAETETRFQQILDHTPVIAYAKDRAGRLVFANREFERRAGIPRERILGRTDRDLFPAAVAASLQANDQRVLEGRSALEFEEVVRFGDEDRTYLSIKFPILDKRGEPTAVGGISTDITERKRADAALRQAAIAVSSAEGAKVFEELARSLAEVLGVDYVLIAVHDERRPGTLRTLAFVGDGQVRPNVDYPIGGTPCNDVCGHDFLLIESGAERRYADDPMLGGMRVTGYAGYPLADATGRSLGLIALMSRSPLRDAPLIESMIKIYAVRAAAEIERGRAEAAMRQSQKMEALGHLTGGIAHDFNNLLSGIMGNLVLASDRDAALADARLARYLDQATLSAKKARDLIRQMLTYSRGNRGERRLMALPTLVEQSAKLLRSSLPSTIDVTTEIPPQVSIARVDPVQVEQILMNLCINARDAMRSQGKIRVGVLRKGDVRGTCASCRQDFAGDFIEVSVTDSGPGISPHVAERMFEPFYSTKEPGKGSGMGLSTVHGALHEQGGHLLVETAPDAGARFRLFFPPTEADPATLHATLPPARRMPRARLSGRVLLVDDEETVLGTMRELLDSWGLEVTTAPGGRQALVEFEADPARFDMVLTDQTMPHVTGIDLARQLSRVRPGIPIVLYTGFGGGIPPGQLAEAGIRAVLAKPVEPGELLAALATALEESFRSEGLEK